MRLRLGQADVCSTGVSSVSIDRALDSGGRADVEQTDAGNARAFLNAFSGIGDVSATDQSRLSSSGGSTPHRASIAVDNSKTDCPQREHSALLPSGRQDVDRTAAICYTATLVSMGRTKAGRIICLHEVIWFRVSMRVRTSGRRSVVISLRRSRPQPSMGTLTLLPSRQQHINTSYPLRREAFPGVTCRRVHR